jgi:hypothetical protein
MSIAVTNDELANIIRLYNKSQIFSVTFVKRTTGTTRRMVCRKGVHSYTTGGSLPYEPTNMGLVGVFDFFKRAYRMVNLEDLTEAKIAGNHYIVTPQQITPN